MMIFASPQRWLRTLTLLGAFTLSACSHFYSSPEGEGTQAKQKQAKTTKNTQVVAEEAPAPENLWEILPRGFSMPQVDDSKVANHLRWLGNNQRYIDRISKQSQPFLYYVTTQLEANDLPLELALLPIVESAYDPLAVSPSRAAGIWQFMPQTGRNFGLAQTQWYDGRRDLIASTDAAIRYLKYLHNMFDDWYLAIAAYNAGEGTIKRAIAKNQRAGHKADFWSLPLSQQTRSYVPQLLALAKVVSNPGKYGLEIPAIMNEPYFTRIALQNPIDIAQAAKQANVDAHQLRLLNAGHLKWLTISHNDHLLVPVAQAPTLSLAINQLPALGPLKTEANYVVKAGDNLGRIARRYGTNIAAIQQANRMKNTQLRIGQQLLIPNQTIVESAAGAKVEQAQAAKRSQAQTTNRYYLVKRGDSLWNVAKKHGIKLSELMQWNNLTSKSTIKPGQKLVVAQVRSNRSNSDGTITYTIQPGDTLGAIANRFEVSSQELLGWNKVKDASYIHPGQELTIHTRSSLAQN